MPPQISRDLAKSYKVFLYKGVSFKPRFQPTGSVLARDLSASGDFVPFTFFICLGLGGNTIEGSWCLVCCTLNPLRKIGITQLTRERDYPLVIALSGPAHTFGGGPPGAGVGPHPNCG